MEDVLRAAAYDRDSDDIIVSSLKAIVAKTAFVQAMKGVLTAGAVKTTKYSSAKLRKMFKSLGKK